MIDRILQTLDKYITALWSRNGLLGVVVVVLLIAFLLTWFGVDVGGYVNHLLGRGA